MIRADTFSRKACQGHPSCKHKNKGTEKLSCNDVGATANIIIIIIIYYYYLISLMSYLRKVKSSLLIELHKVQLFIFPGPDIYKLYKCSRRVEDTQRCYVKDNDKKYRENNIVFLSL